MGFFNTTSSDAGTAAAASGQTVSTFLGGLGTGIALFGVEVLVFFLLHNSLNRIYRPKTYLVPEKERTAAPPATWFSWILPVFTTSNAELIQKCGLDAYFFLRYLRMLLKIFIPTAMIALPVLLPINIIWSRGVRGLDKLSWNSVDKRNTDRFWAQLGVALLLLLWIFYVVRGELRGYIRVRQAYLTSPQHRLRASATTVLITSIPRKWLTYEALNGLYDVFPGGIRNIWINRDFDELEQKIELRDKYAKMLEGAETNLVRNATKKHMERVAKAEKKAKKGHADGKEISPPFESPPRSFAASSREKGIAGVNGTGPESPIWQEQHTQEMPLAREETPRGRPPHKHSAQKSLTIQEPSPPTRDMPSFEITTPVDSETAITDHATRDSQGRTRHHHWAQDQAHGTKKRGLKFWQGNSHGIRVPSPEPHKRVDTDAAPHDASAGAQPKLQRQNTVDNTDLSSSKLLSLFLTKTKTQDTGVAYVDPADEAFADDEGFEEQPVWKQYLDYGERDSKRLPLFGQSWLPWMPSWTFIGKKVDVIYYCRKEVARLNMEIEHDQSVPEKYPLMNSAFIQFNHQVAAHMACQCVSHHAPHHMGPRIVEIAPQDVIWNNLSIKWWERHLRKAVVLALVSGLVIAWAIPTSFLASITNLNYIAQTWPHVFGWIKSLPKWLISTLQGVIPVLALLVLGLLLPVILRFAATQQGVHTGMSRELSVQSYYFAFSFVQLFLVVTISTSLFKVFDQIIHTPYNTPQILSTNIPKSSNFFYNFMLIQGLSVSAGTLAQIGTLFVWFILRRLVDGTARQKFNRQLNLPTTKWGTFFPVYTTLGCIAVIFSVISPLILVFAIISFSLFWFVYRYQTLYVTKTRFDTGGLMFPKAVNQLFVGVYSLELSLIGLFFLARDEKDNVACVPQAIIMIVVLVGTIGYQISFNYTYHPLYRYMPITLEDEAVTADQEYARMQASKWDSHDGALDGSPGRSSEDIEDSLERREREEDDEERAAEAIELEELQDRRNNDQGIFKATSHKVLGGIASVGSKLTPNVLSNRGRSSWAHKSSDGLSATNVESSPAPRANAAPLDFATIARRRLERLEALRVPVQLDGLQGSTGIHLDPESQTGKGGGVGDALFGAFNDEIEDLTPEERDVLVQRAFLHKALRARRPVVWIPRDELGVSADEIRRTEAYSEHLSISDEWTGLDQKARVVISRAPPDFSEVDLIEL